VLNNRLILGKLDRPRGQHDPQRDQLAVLVSNNVSQRDHLAAKLRNLKPQASGIVDELVEAVGHAAPPGAGRLHRLRSM
jgi:hypothetical protein